MFREFLNTAQWPVLHYIDKQTYIWVYASNCLLSCRYTPKTIQNKLQHKLNSPCSKFNASRASSSDNPPCHDCSAGLSELSETSRKSVTFRVSFSTPSCDCAYTRRDSLNFVLELKQHKGPSPNLHWEEVWERKEERKEIEGTGL